MKFLLPLYSVVRWLEVQSHRRAIYSLGVLVLPLLTGAALLSDGQAQKILAILALLAGAGVPSLARKHTPKRSQAGNVDVLFLLVVATFVLVLLHLFGVSFH